MADSTNIPGFKDMAYYTIKNRKKTAEDKTKGLIFAKKKIY